MGPPPCAVCQRPPSPHRWTARLDAQWQQRLKPRPLAVRQLVSVADREGARTTARVLLEPADGWIEDHRARLDRVRQAWPQPLA
ncbi:DUF5959 family protein [Streptomyces inhibens]|uniref:DUF5959 family protein n=1 Tax=Streptomyces inhibens TaxID=2293571 RepID=UPI0037952A57